MRDSVQLALGNLVLSINLDVFRWDMNLNSPYASFGVEYGCDVVLHVYDGPGPNIPPRRQFRNNVGRWAYWHDGCRHVFHLYPQASTHFFSRMAIIEPNLRAANIYVEPVSGFDSHYPLELPLDRLLVIMLLTQRQGTMVHACGIAYEGQGLLFIGACGAGKSTMARLWRDGTDATILSDDCIILRREHDCWMIYGTPWHSDVQEAAPTGVPLEKILFIEHGSENIATGEYGMSAASDLLTHLYAPFWNAESLARTLEVVEGVVLEIPCYQLGFVPDESVIDFVRGLE